MRSLSDCGEGAVLFNVPHHPENPRWEAQEVFCGHLDWPASTAATVSTKSCENGPEMGQVLTKPFASSFKRHNSDISQIPLQWDIANDWVLASGMWAEVLYATSRTGPWNHPTCVSSILSVPSSEDWMETSSRRGLQWPVTWGRNKLLLCYPWYFQIITVVNLRWPVHRGHWHCWRNFWWNIRVANCETEEITFHLHLKILHLLLM